jgi:FixJ family two-component response regulator
MATPETMVFVIDDDPSFRRSTAALLGSAGFNVHAFSSAEEFCVAGAQTYLPV